MFTERYDYSTLSFTEFEFYSDGPKGKIKKIIKYTAGKSWGIDFYNLGFGDWNERENKIDDFVTSGNGDAEKILATVASSVIEFTNVYKVAVFAKGSTSSRTRLYQMGLNKYNDDISRLFNIFGLVEQHQNFRLQSARWYRFERGVNYDAFLVTRK